MQAFTILNHSLVRDEIASVHRPDCKGIERERLDHGSSVHHIIAETGDDAADVWIDEELQEMGYTVDDMKVHSCTKKAAR